MPPQHGATRYTDYGCRCDACRAAHAAKQRAHRTRRRAAHPEENPALEHGTKATYVKHGCRCDPCVEAQREANRQRPSRAQQGS